jgi:multidrug efflux pump subunit AcrA (membrane-fusion protein)
MPIEAINNNEIISTPGYELNTDRSEQLQDIISTKPGFLVRWGNTFFLVIMILVILACWFIRYPDLVQAPAKMTSINAPKPIICRTNGELIKIFILENQKIKCNQVIGYIESIGNHDVILSLATNLDSIKTLLNDNKSSQIRNLMSSPANLGELQVTYQAFLQSWLNFENFIEGGFIYKKIEVLEKDKINLQKLHKNLEEQKELQEQDLELVRKTFEANESLKKEKVISEFDYRIEQSKLLNKKQSIPQIRSAIINNEGQQVEKEKEIMELRNSIHQQKATFQQSLNTFISQVDEWIKLHVLISPIEGKVAFDSFIQENQQLVVGQIVCFINPENSQYFAELTIPQSNFGKVRSGQNVLLRFQSYPFQEFGSVLGKIEFISHVPTKENGYLAKVSLVNGLKTTYGKEIQFRDGLSANAEIITKDMRLIERFYYSVMSQVKR